MTSRRALLSIMMLTVAACEPTHLVYVTDTVLGVDVGVSAEGIQKGTIGYERDTYTIIPRREEGGEAMTLAAVSAIRIDGLSEIQFNHFVSTGESAIRVAQDKVGFERIREAIYGSIEPPGTTEQADAGTGGGEP